MFHRALFFLFFLGLQCHAACTANIPEDVKKEYGADLQNAFVLQADGLSTSAMFHFEQGCMKALQAGETPQKIEAIRKLFVWYRTFGYYLGLMKQDPKIAGQYCGNGRYSSASDYRPRSNSNAFGNKSQNEIRTEYLIGTAQILSGILCVWLLPPCPGKYALGVSLASQGFIRIYDAVKPLLFQQDISLVELQKVGETIKAID